MFVDFQRSGLDFNQFNFSFFLNRSTGNTLEELHRFFEDDPNDYQLEIEAEIRLKSLYSCLVVNIIFFIKRKNKRFFFYLRMQHQEQCYKLV